MKFTERVSCPKCTFAPTFSKEWKVEYKDECYGLKKCGWNDNDIKEHVHKICPECGYTMACETADYDKLKRGQWNTTDGNGEFVAPDNTGVRHKNAVKPEVQAQIDALKSNKPVVTKPVVTVASKFQPVVAKPFVKTPVVATKCRTCPVTANGNPVTE
jgi:hypothetical protein